MCIGVAKLPVYESPSGSPVCNLSDGLTTCCRTSSLLFVVAVCRPVFCELSAKVPVGDGLSISPCAVFTHRGGASSLAYVMQSSWRF